MTAGAKQATAGTRAILARAMRLEPLCATPADLAAELEQRFGWVYPSTWRASLPAKVSVTELRLLDQFVAVDDDAPAQELAAARQETGWPLPVLTGAGRRRRLLTPALRGTIIHNILGRMKLAGNLAAGALTEAVTQLVDRRVLPPEAGDLAPDDLACVAWFLGTELGRRVAGAADGVARELPFTLAVAAARIAELLQPAISAPASNRVDAAAAAATSPAGEVVMVQGIIDCLVWGTDGAELVEYKTDRVDPAAAATMIDRYRLQLSFYVQAVESAYRRPVTAAHLVLLTPRVILTVPREYLSI